MVEETTKDLFKRVEEGLPSRAKISDIRFEGCEIVLYTKDKDFFAEPGTDLKNMVSTLKKRIILRPDPSICLDMEDARKEIGKIVPSEAGLKEITFLPEFGEVIIEADKPGLAIGKGGELLAEMRRKIHWLPTIKRAPAIKSDIVKTLRELLYKESEFRKDFLDKVGKSIHSGWKETEWVRMTALGGFREVGRSCILLSTPESRILMDCGIKPGTNEFPYLSIPEVDIHNLNAVVLSHAHMDHSGLIPWLYEYGCTAPLYCTVPTRDLMVLLALDYMGIMQKEGRQALYTSKGIKEAVKHCITLEYGEVSDIAPDMRLTLLNSGHILGSALVHVHIGNGLHNVLYTSDIKFDRTALYEPASTDFSRAETVITESTYGAVNDIQPKRSEAEDMLVAAASKAIERGGKVIIPSFAVERAQDLMIILQKGGIKCPVYLDGMVWDATAIHTTYPEYMNRDLQKQILQQGVNPFTDEIFTRIGSQEDREKILKKKEACVIIATSGMLVGGPSVWWLKQLADDAKNMIVFVGYQAEGTLGKRVQKGWKEIPMEEDGKTKAVALNFEIVTVPGLSGHSDRKQLVNYIAKLRQIPERIIVDHGEASKCMDLARSLHQMFRCETTAMRTLK